MWQITCLITLMILILILTGVAYRYMRITPVMEHTIIEGRKVVKRTYGTFQVWEVYNIFTPAECDTIIRLAEHKGFKEGAVWGRNNVHVRNDKVRKSKVAWLTNKADEAVMKMAKLTEKISGLPIDNQEFLQVAKYDAGGYYNEHRDTCMATKEECAERTATSGDRKSTLLVYLNENYHGGETYFPKIDLKIKPERGKGLFFINMDWQDQPQHLSLHQGLSVEGGPKYICTKWSHPRAFPVYHT